MRKEFFTQTGSKTRLNIIVTTIEFSDMQHHKRPPASLIFIFGGSGDLNLRKLSPALYNLFLDKWMPDKFSIVGIGRSEYTNEDYRERLLDGIQKFSRRKGENNGKWSEFLSTCYLPADGCRRMPALIQAIADVVKAKEEEFGEHPNVIFYLAVAPQLVPDIASKLGTV